MTLPELLARLDRDGVTLALELDVEGPEGTLTDELVEAIRTHKATLCQHLARELLWRHLEPQRWGPQLLPEGDPEKDRDEPPGNLAGV